MQVYIEYAILDNLVIDYLLLKVTFALTGKPINRKRLFLCTFLGTTGAVLLPLVKAKGVIQIIIKIMILILITLLADKNWHLKGYLYFSGVFLGLTFLAGGGIYAITSAVKVNPSSEISIALMIIPVYILLRGILRVVKIIYRRREIIINQYKTAIYVGDKRVLCVGFFDTGNSAYYKDKPVIFCTERVFRPLINPNTIKSIFRYEINTVAGKTFLTAIVVDKVSIFFEKGEYNSSDVVACLTNKINFGCDVILHPALYKGENKNETDRKTEKIS